MVAVHAHRMRIHLNDGYPPPATVSSCDRGQVFANLESQSFGKPLARNLANEFGFDVSKRLVRLKRELLSLSRRHAYDAEAKRPKHLAAPHREFDCFLMVRSAHCCRPLGQ